MASFMMAERKDQEEEGKIHRLDSRPAELGAGLRRLFRPLIEEPVPDEIARLSERLESKLTGMTDPEDPSETG